MPGKCLNTGMTCCDLVPVAKARASRPTRVSLNPNVRACWYMNEAVESATSATGARLTLIEDVWSAAALEDPCWVTRSTLLSTPICRALSVGPAHGIRRTVPPSWSTMMNSGGWPPAAAAACSFEIAETSADFVVMLKPNRTMPPTSPRRTRPSRLALGVVPSMRITSF